MMLLRAFAALGLSAGLLGSSAAQWSPAEKRGIEDLLFLGNLTVQDLNFERRLQSDGWRLPLVDACLDSPVSSAERLMELHKGSGGETSRLLRKVLDQVFGQPAAALPALDLGVLDEAGTLPAPYREPCHALARAVARASHRVREASKALTAEERRDLIESLPRWAAERPELKWEFASRPLIGRNESMALLAKVDLALIRGAAIELAEAIEDQLPRLQSIARTNPVEGLHKFSLGRGMCVLGGHGTTVHDERDAVLTIDLGGDDRYKGRHGVGVGYAGVLIDLGGDDRYEVPDLNLGSGVLGIGIAVDLGGNDVVEAGSLALGCGIGGVGVFRKIGGNDRYSAVALAQGFGMAGVGLMADSSGIDEYHAELAAQGAARTAGLGWLADGKGDDVYRIASRFPESRSQGYSAGYRSDFGGLSGGVGLLSDLAGSDVYLAQRGAQAAGDCFAVGSLLDEEGNDTYRLTADGQSFAARSAGSFLFDLAGDDAYVSQGGGSHAASHDLGVAIMLDRQGDDSYLGPDGMLAFASAGGTSLLLDAGGEDRYLGAGGTASPYPAAASLSLFADLNGPDRYGLQLDGGGAVAVQGLGVAWDAETRSDPARQPDPPSLPKPGSIPMPGEAEMAALYRTAADEYLPGPAYEAIGKLVGIGMPAFNWMIANRLKGIDGAGVRVFALVADGIGQDARNAIALRAADRDDAIALPALRVCVAGNIREASAVIVQALERPALRRLAARHAGEFGNGAAVPALMLLCAQKDRTLVHDSLVSLALLADPQSAGTGQAMLDHADFLVRKAGLMLVSRFQEAAYTSGRVFLRDADERRARIGCELLAKVPTPEAVQELVAAVGDNRPGVRLQAALALAGRWPIEHRSKLIALRRDAHPLVRAIAQKIDPGR